MQHMISSMRTKKLLILGLVMATAFILISLTDHSTSSTESDYPWIKLVERYRAVSLIYSSQLRIAIIGSSGYIGSSLLVYLQKVSNWTVVGYDRIYPGQASYEISNRDLQSFHVVVYLGGLTGRAMCDEHPREVEQENVQDIYNLAKRMLHSQVLIFASTSAITEGSGSTPADEDFSVRINLLDAYASSLYRREQKLRRLALASDRAPRMIGLRLGTVAGVSPSQRVDLSPMAFVCQAFLNGRLRITHPESHRAFLSMKDLMRAFTVIIRGFQQIQRFDIFHLQSFSASISKLANAVAHLTGALIHNSDHPPNRDSLGFSLDNSKFRTTFNFTFENDLHQTISTLVDNAPFVCPGRKSRLDNDSVPCVVCGSRRMYTVLNLHEQPLANDFQMHPSNATSAKRFPLRLVRCPVCHHAQLSYIVDRKYLFSHYLYQSGTSASLKNYFAWLAAKTINESGVVNGTVLEIACNDGTQLNEYRKRGWRTIGVDPAQNLAEIARKQGHTVYTGFWGVTEFPELTSLPSLNVIIAQNVLAHVENPVQFLRACAALMLTNHTKLYIQTSQCKMYETGQFDTVYHEHVSFFTAHSFKKLADLVGLTIMQFEITPIHGESCLVMFQRFETSNAFPPENSTQAAPSLASALEKERHLGIDTTWFYVKYEAQAESMRQWINQQLRFLQAQDHTIVAYGAAAKGMVLLHFLLQRKDRAWNISFVVDDAPLKQNAYCPGTSIPVRPTAELSACDSTKPLTIIIFAWNFWEEILQKIRTETLQKKFKTIFIILPFPQQQLMKVEENSTTLLVQNLNKPLPWPALSIDARRHVILIAHFYNEEFLLPYWIRHHASMFDMAILIDYNSTDRSVQIIQQEAPNSWQIVRSRNPLFEAESVDREVVDYEKKYPNAWKIAVNIPEFLVHPNLRRMLAEANPPENGMAFRFRSVLMSGNDSIPLTRFSSLIKQRSVYFYDATHPDPRHGETWASRFLHCFPAAKYASGRHVLLETAWQWAPIGFIAKFQFTPWPEIVQRKLQIKTRIPASDFARNFGYQHNVDLEQLKGRKSQVDQLDHADLRDFTAWSPELMMAHRVWREFIDE